MTYGLTLRDGNGFEYYNTDDTDSEFILILDVIRGNSNGSKSYSDLAGGSLANLQWLAMSDDPSRRPPSVSLSGSTLTWVTHNTTTFSILVSIK